MYHQYILFIEFLFKLQALEHISCPDSIQIIFAKQMCLYYYDFEPNIHPVVNLKFQQTKSTNSIFSLNKRSNIKVDSKEFKNKSDHKYTKIKQRNCSHSDLNKKSVSLFVEWGLNNSVWFPQLQPPSRS